MGVSKRRLNWMTYFFFFFFVLGFDHKLKFYSCACIIGVPLSSSLRSFCLWHIPIKVFGQPGSTPNLHIANNHCTPHAPSSSLLILSTILSFFILPSFLIQLLLLHSILLLLYTTIYYPLSPRPTTNQPTNELSTFTVETFSLHTHIHT